ncbi:MAG: hypothetical protein R3F38_00930 [Gammaproteobacteria bacterium]
MVLIGVPEQFVDRFRISQEVAVSLVPARQGLQGRIRGVTGC